MNSQNATGKIDAFQAGKKLWRWKNILRILLIVLAAVLVVELFFYCATAIATSSKSFPIYLDVSPNTRKGKTYLVSLSETADFADPTVHLKAGTIDEMSNISGSSLPYDINGEAEGSHNGKNYIAYTFYLKNAGDDCAVQESMEIVFKAKGAEEAIRVRVYRNGLPTTYAKAAKDGIPEPGTAAFPTEDLIFFERTPLAAGQIVKYTIVVWLEGDDPDCVNAIRGGSVRLLMSFDVQDK